MPDTKFATVFSKELQATTLVLNSNGGVTLKTQNAADGHRLSKMADDMRQAGWVVQVTPASDGFLFVEAAFPCQGH
jgi:hypothetical protein